jgi:hypothetical protein
MSGATLFPERPLGSAIVNTVCRGGGSLLYVTAPAVIDADEQIDYFVSLIPEEQRKERNSWQNRITLVSLADTSARWLSDKVMDHNNTDAATARLAIREFVNRERKRGCEVQLSYYEPSANLERLASELRVPGDQADSRYISLGTKASGRDLFASVGIDIPVGTSLCYTLIQLAESVVELFRRGHRKLVLKLSSTEYGAGLGNALLDLSMLEHSGDQTDLVTTVLECLPGATLVDGKIGWADFVEMIMKSGVIAEELIEGEETRSPSFQGRISSDGEVKTLSTHDQILGGSGQTYAGSSFPADDDYRAAVIDHGIRVGRRLSDLGVRPGDYGVDFIAARHGTSWRVLGCELNLRTTGTKHGFTMVSGLLDVSPDNDGRLFVDGSERVYEASDSIMDSRLIGLRPRELIKSVQNSPLRYDHDRKTGAVLHLMSSLLKYGNFGAVCIGRDRMEVKRMMRDLREIAVGSGAS